MTDFSRVVQDAFHKQRLDQARGLHQLMKDQMMTGDVPTTVDGPASGRKRKKKGPGDCGPNGAHVAKTKVDGYVRVLRDGTRVHVAGYVRGGHAAIDAMSDEAVHAAVKNPRNKTFLNALDIAAGNAKPHRPWKKETPKPKDLKDVIGPGRMEMLNHALRNGMDLNAARDAIRQDMERRGEDVPDALKPAKTKDPKKGPTDEQKKRHAAEMRGAAKPKTGPAAKKPAAGGGKFTSVKPGEEKVIDGVTIRRSKAIGRMGSTYTLSTPHIGQVVYGRKQGQAKAEHEYLVAHDGGAKKDPKYTWQAGYEIGDVLEDGSVVKAFWRNELIVKRPDGSKGSHSALSTLPKKKSKPDAKQPKGVKDESKNPDFKPDLSGMVEGDPDGPGDGPFELTDTAVKDPSKSDEFADILEDYGEDYGADIRSKIDSVANENGGLRGVADGANGSVVVWTKSGVFRITP